ncbi:MAG: hypothetical protein ABWY05_13275 [Noviherbaspirillum sp.]
MGGPGRQAGSARDALHEVGQLADTQEFMPRIHMWENLLADGRHPLACLPEAAGLLLGQRNDDEANFCFVTRQEVVQQVRWGGEPHKHVVPAPDGRVILEPRRSFAEWKQALSGHSEAWTPAEADALTTLLQIAIEVNKLHLNRRLQKKLHWRAYHDQLTGLLNRQAMEDDVSPLQGRTIQLRPAARPGQLQENQ